MKLNDNFSNKNEFIYLNKFDFSKNDSFGLPIQNKNSKTIKEYNNNINESGVDPRLELTLNYLDIISTLPTFITNNIFFNDLLLLSKNDLIELGFSLVERNRILYFSQEFKKFGKKYNIQEINNFFDEFQNLNMRLITINNNLKSFPSNEENEVNNNFMNADNNKNINYNDRINYDMPNTNSLYIEDKKYQINNKNQNNIINNDFYPKSNLFLKCYNNKPNNINKKNNLKNKNLKQEQKYQESLNSNINHNINNFNNNYQEEESSKLIRQNSKASKTSSYSKNSKSRLVTISKNFLPPSTSSDTIVQKYQNLAEEIDNYFKKYNDYKENKKNKKKKYQIITSSNHSKKKYNPIFINNSKNNYDKKKNSNNLSNVNNESNFNNNNIENNFEQNINNELLQQKLKELQQKKKELKEKLNIVCDKENRKKIIIKYLEEEEEDK